MELKNQKAKCMKSKYRKNKRVDKFKYLGGWVLANGLGKVANKERVMKQERASKITWHV